MHLLFETHFGALVLIRFSIPFSVYDALTGEIVKTLKEQSDCVRDVSWHPYLNELVGSSWDRTIVKWDYKSHDVIEDTKRKEENAEAKRKASLERSKRRRLHDLLI